MRVSYPKRLLSRNLIALVIFNFACNTILAGTEQFVLLVITLNVSSMLKDLYLTRGRGLMKLEIE